MNNKNTCVRYEVASMCLKIFVWFPSHLTCRDKFIRDGKRRRVDPNVRAEAKHWERSRVAQRSFWFLKVHACDLLVPLTTYALSSETQMLCFMTISIYFFDPVFTASTVKGILYKFKSHDLYNLGLHSKATEIRLEKSDLFIYTALKLDLCCSDLAALTVWVLGLGVLIMSNAQKHLFPLCSSFLPFLFSICVSVMGNVTSLSLISVCLGCTRWYLKTLMRRVQPLIKWVWSGGRANV